MNNVKCYLTSLCLILIHIATANAQLFKPKFDFPDAKLTAKQVCGKPCQPGNEGILLPLYRKLYSPDVDDNSNERSVALSILGSTYPAGDLSGSKAWSCSNTSESPFKDTDISTVGTPSGTTFDYKRSEKLNLDINAVVKTNLDEIKANNPGINASKLTSFGAKLTAAYAKFNGKDLTIEGRYTEWKLKKNVIEKLAKNQAYQECKKYLADNNHRIILAIGLVYYDISYAQNSLDKIAADLQAEAVQNGISGEISVSFKREVSKDLKKVTKNYYQIIVWRSAGLSDLSVVATSDL